MKRLVPPVLVALAIACAAPSCASNDVTIATLPGVDAATSSGCTSTSDCPTGSFCDMSTCYAATGTCAIPPAPATCTNDEQSVCGCDGITYFNDCLRKANSISGESPNFCPQGIGFECGGPNDTACPTGAECFQLAGGAPGPCSADPPGTCWVLPDECPPPSGQSPDRWDSCVPGQHCLDTCTAIRNGGPYRRSALCH
jgi:hypothetical protein